MKSTSANEAATPTEEADGTPILTPDDEAVLDAIWAEVAAGPAYPAGTAPGAPATPGK